MLMINSTTMFLLNLAIRTPCRSLLDLGTGCGVVAILSAPQLAENVTATDLSSRSASFCPIQRLAEWTPERRDPDRRFVSTRCGPAVRADSEQSALLHHALLEQDFRGESHGTGRVLPESCQAGSRLSGRGRISANALRVDGNRRPDPGKSVCLSGSKAPAATRLCGTGGSYDPVRYAQIRLPVVTAPAGKESDYRNFESWVELLPGREG